MAKRMHRRVRRGGIGIIGGKQHARCAQTHKPLPSPHHAHTNGGGGIVPRPPGHRHAGAQANKLDPANYGPAVHVFQLTHDIFRRFHKSLSPADVKFLCENALCMLGFDDAAKDMETAYMSATKNHVTINYKGWDTHKQHFEIMRRRLPELGAGFATLIALIIERFRST